MAGYSMIRMISAAAATNAERIHRRPLHLEVDRVSAKSAGPVDERSDDSWA